MATTVKTKEVQLAVYMERLDNYIQSQTELNKTLTFGMQKISSDVEEIKHWRTKIYGAKAAFITAGILIVHTFAILGSLVAILLWIDN
jgi:hypothetical protein